MKQILTVLNLCEGWNLSTRCKMHCPFHASTGLWNGTIQSFTLWIHFTLHTHKQLIFVYCCIAQQIWICDWSFLHWETCSACTIHHSHHYHIHSDECMSITIPSISFHWLPCEQTLTDSSQFFLDCAGYQQQFCFKLVEINIFNIYFNF